MTTKENLKVLVGAYRNELGEKVCLSCPGSLNQMIITLQKYYNMSNFQLKGNSYYRISKDSSKTINNNIITDELAIEFLQVNPERIKLFAKYPENWQELIGEEETVEQEVEREELMKLKMYELREQYPDIKETSKEDFITEIYKQRD